MTETKHAKVEKEKTGKVRLVLLIGRGSRTPALYRAITTRASNLDLKLVISHRKPPEGKTDVIGVELAKKLGFGAIYWNRVQMVKQAKLASPDLDEEQYKKDWESALGSFLKQEAYNPDFIFMTGWDLVLHREFLQFFSSRVINVHPAYLPDVDEDQNQLTLPDGTKSPVFRGAWDQIAGEILSSGATYTGATIHFITADGYDIGPVIARGWVKIKPQETVDSLRAKMNRLEDQLSMEVLKLLGQKKIKLAKNKVLIVS